MAGSNKGLWLVMGGGAVAGLAFAIYYVGVIGPRGERKEMIAEIEEWEALWTGTRACLVGADAADLNGYDAVILREAREGDPLPGLRRCTRGVRELRRPGDSHTGDHEIEKRWLELEGAVARLGNALTLRLDPRAGGSVATLRAQLAEGVERLDASLAALRGQAGLPVPHAESVPAIDDPETRIVIRDGDAPVPPAHVHLSGDTLLVQGGVGDTTVLAVIRGPERVELSRIAPRANRAADDTPWGTWFSPTEAGGRELRAGEILPSGEPAGDGVVIFASAAPDENLVANAALGAGDTRVVIYSHHVPNEGGDQWLARSRDGGATFGEPQRLEAGLYVSPHLALDWAARRVDLTWRTRDGSSWWLPLEAATLDGDLVPRVLLAAEHAAASLDERGCHGASAVWWGAGGRLFYSPDRTSPAEPVADARGLEGILSCTDDEALAVSLGDGAVTLQRCAAGGCQPVLSAPRPKEAWYAAADTSAGPVIATLTADLLLLWTGADEHRVLRAPDDMPLHSLVEWDGTLYAIFTDFDHVRLIPIPR